MSNRLLILALILVGTLCVTANAQNQPSSGSSQPTGQESMPGMDMSGHHMSHMKDMPMGDKDADGDAGAHVMHAMEGHMDMGPHMKMTALRKPQPGGAERAQKVSDEAKKVAEYYTDYQKALADGFKIFHPELPQK